jgi:cysteine synthase A
VKYSGRLAEKLAKSESNGAIWANQFDNVANRRGHYETTGPEIFDDTSGKVDGFVCAVGSGGTLAGVGMALKERNAAIKIALADPMGAALYEFYTHGQLKSEGSSITEGIGQGRITANLEGAPVDFAYQIPDEEALPIVFDLAEHEGLLLGGSSGVNIAGAIRLARQLGRAILSSRSSPIPGCVTPQSFSIPPFCARKACLSPPGSNAKPPPPRFISK